MHLRFRLITDKFRSKIFHDSFGFSQRVLATLCSKVRLTAQHLQWDLPEYSSLSSTQLCSGASKMDTSVFGSIASWLPSSTSCSRPFYIRQYIGRLPKVLLRMRCLWQFVLVSSAQISDVKYHTLFEVRNFKNRLTHFLLLFLHYLLRNSAHLLSSNYCCFGVSAACLEIGGAWIGPSIAGRRLQFKFCVANIIIAESDQKS